MTIGDLKKTNPEILYGEKWGRGYVVAIAWPEGYHGAFHYPPSTAPYDGNLRAVSERMAPLGWTLKCIGIGDCYNGKAHMRFLVPQEQPTHNRKKKR